MVTWYFPHWLIRRIARFQDARAGLNRPSRKGKVRKESRAAMLDRLARGGRDPSDLADIVDLQMVAVQIVTPAAAIPVFLAGGIDALTAGAVPLWLIAVLIAMPFGVFSFMLVLWLSGRAALLADLRRGSERIDRAIARLERRPEPTGQLDWLARTFLIPRRANLLIMPLVTAIFAVALYFSD